MARQADKEVTMAHYAAKFVKCPFYKRNDNNRIICEGVSKKNKLHLVFEDPISKSRYMKDHCNGIQTCQSCLIHKVMSEKWEDG